MTYEDPTSPIASRTEPPPPAFAEEDEKTDPKISITIPPPWGYPPESVIITEDDGEIQ